MLKRYENENCKYSEEEMLKVVTRNKSKINKDFLTELGDMEKHDHDLYVKASNDVLGDGVLETDDQAKDIIDLFNELLSKK